MKIDLSTIDREQFLVHDHFIGGEVVHLVQPNLIGCSWTQENKIFRSSVWDHEGNLVSAGFPKFTNWGEKPNVFPVPSDLKGAVVMEKLDGSLLIVSMWKGNLILRTRGTVDASKLDNGFELESFKKYASAFLDWANNRWGETWPTSFLFEWTSPNQKIILNYGDEPIFHLIGAVDHDKYFIWAQIQLDVLAPMVNLIRPVCYTFDDIFDLLNKVNDWKGKEGVCVYTFDKNLGPMVHKVKGAWYLALHHMKSELASFDKVIDVWFTLGQPGYQDFYTQIATRFDHELAQQIQGDMSRICDGWKQVQKIIEGMKTFVDQTLKPLPTRRDQAHKVISSYGNTNRASFVFKILDGKSLSQDELKKLLYQVLKD